MGNRASIDFRAPAALVTIAVAVGVLTAACTETPAPPNPKASVVENTTERFKDLGTIQIPNKTTRVHAYELKPKGDHAQYLYILEDGEGNTLAGVPVVEIQPHGKGTKAVAVVTQVDSSAQTTPAAAQVHQALSPQAQSSTSKSSGAIEVATKLTCDSIEQCERKLKALRETQ